MNLMSPQEAQQNISATRLLVVTGPTASGKSSFALSLAKLLNGVIINADSMQWYDGLPILTAQPGWIEKEKVPHFLYGTNPLNAFGSAASWQEEVVKCINQLREERRSPWVILVGGTGLYIKALTMGLSAIPAIPLDIREAVRTLAGTQDIDTFKAYVMSQDPELASGNVPLEKQRLSRALEVKLTTGRSIRHFQGKAVPPLSFSFCNTIVIKPERSILHKNMLQRIHEMLEQGVLDEVQKFWDMEPEQDCALRQALGLMPLTQHIEGQLSLEAAIEQMHIQTRQYAKRQLTWIKSQGDQNPLINPTVDEVLRFTQ